MDKKSRPKVLSRKPKRWRPLTVDGHRYWWQASGDDGYNRLTVRCPYGAGGKILCSFGYHDRVRMVSPELSELYDRVLITPRLVRRVIQRAIVDGYDRLHFRGEWRVPEESIELEDAPRDPRVCGTVVYRFV